MGALDWRRAASKDLARKVDIHKRVEDRQAYLRLERDRLFHLRVDLPCNALDEALEHVDSAILCLGEARRHLEGKP